MRKLFGALLCLASINANAFELGSLGFEYQKSDRTIDVNSSSDSNNQFEGIELKTRSKGLGLGFLLDSDSKMVHQVSFKYVSEGPDESTIQPFDFSVQHIAIELRNVTITDSQAITQIAFGLHYVEYDFAEITGFKVDAVGVFMGYAASTAVIDDFLDIGFSLDYYAGKDSKEDGFIHGLKGDVFLTATIFPSHAVRLKAGYRMRSYDFSERQNGAEFEDKVDGPYVGVQLSF